MKLKYIVNEIEHNEKKDSDTIKLTSINKKNVLEKIKKYNKYASDIYIKDNLSNVVNEVSSIIDGVESIMTSDDTNSFDKITINRNVKDLKSLLQQFKKTAYESEQLNQRLLSLYEDIGLILNRYFNIEN